MSLWHWIKSKIWQNRFGQVVDNAGFASATAPRRTVHVVVMDGTLSSLEEGFETNAGLAYQLLKRNAGPGVTLYYQPGLQFDRGNLLASAWSVLTSSGLDLQIQQVYGALASRYQSGDEIFLIGYSRDRSSRVAAARSGHPASCFHGLSQLLGRQRRSAGLCRRILPLGCSNRRDWGLGHGQNAWAALAGGSGGFLRENQFHNHHISACVGAGFQALALDETRDTYRPEMWEDTPDRPVHLQQVWFVGNHGDVGGQVMGSPHTTFVKYTLRLADATIARARPAFAQSLGRGICARCSCAFDRQLERIELSVLGAAQTCGWAFSFRVSSSQRR